MSSVGGTYHFRQPKDEERIDNIAGACAACGLLAARNIYARLEGKELPAPPIDTMCGALIQYLTTENKHFQPMGANMGILPRTEEINTIRDKRERYAALSQNAQNTMHAWVEEYK